MTVRCVVHYRSVCAPCSAPVRKRVRELGAQLPEFQASLMCALRLCQDCKQARDVTSLNESVIFQIARTLASLMVGSRHGTDGSFEGDASEFEQQVFRAEWGKVTVAVIALVENVAYDLFAELLAEMQQHCVNHHSHSDLARIDQAVKYCFSGLDASRRRRSKLKREYAASIEMVKTWCRTEQPTGETLLHASEKTLRRSQPKSSDDKVDAIVRFCLWRMRVRREGLADDPDFIFIGSLLKYVSVAPEHQHALKQNAVVALQKQLLECWSQGIFSVCASLLCYEGLTEYAESFSASRKAVLAELIADGQHILAQDFAKQWRIRSVNMQSGSALSMPASERVDEYMCVPADVVVLLLRCEESLSAAEQIVGDICQKTSSQSAWSLGVDAEWEPVRGSRETKIQPRPVILQMALDRSHVLVADFKELEAADLLERVDQLICSLLFSVSWIIGFGFLETDVRYLKSAWGEYNFPRAFESHSKKYLEAQLFLKNCKSFSSLVTTVFPGFMLDKREQCSKWESERPLRDTQISYAALDAYVLVLVYRELYELSRERMLRDLQLHCRDKAHLVSRESLTDSQRQRERKCVAFVLSKSCEMTSLDDESPLFIVVATRPGFVCDMDALRQALDLSDEWSIRMASISECITEFGAVPGCISVCGFRRPDVRVFMDATLKDEVGREVIFSGSTPDDALLCTPGAWEGIGMWFTASVCKQVTPKERPLPSDEVAVGLWYESTEPDAYPMPTKHARRLDCTLKINEAARVFSGSQPAFVLDGTCIGLARRLRAVGIDAIYCESKNSAWIIEQATLSSRVLLSRDCDLIGQVHRGNATVVAWYIRSQSTMQQIREVLEVFDLKVAESQLLSRCVKCNASCFQEIPKTSVYGRVPARTHEIYDQFWTCGGCDQIFWRGLRFEHATRSLDTLVNDLE